MSNPENNPETKDNQNIEKSSLLEQIIQTSHESDQKPDQTEIPQENGETPTPETSNTGASSTPVKKTRDPMTAGMVLKLIGTFLIIAIIFFGSFLAYIVFNPAQAGFFVNIFGINPNDIQNLLKKLINGSFGTTVLIFSIIWIISLFKAIWTPKDQKRKRIISWFSATLIGILLFSILGSWAFLFKIINATDYANTGGEVTIYDNELYVNEKSREYARISNTNNLIGPITLKFDLSSNAKTISKKSLIDITSYEINFDGAKCSNESSIIKGSDPVIDQGIICTFDQVRTYNIRGTYAGKDRLGESHTINIPLNAVEVKGVLEISTTVNKDKKRVITINASKIKNLGNPRWIYSSRENTVLSQTSITEEISSTPLMICLMVMSDSCDRTFVVSDTDVSLASIEGGIVFEQDSGNPLGAILTLSGVNISSNEITNIDWIDEDGTRLCEGVSEKCEYRFNGYGTKNVTATITLANKKVYPIQTTFELNAPLVLIQHAKIYDQENKFLNEKDTFDPVIGGYVIRDIAVPTKLTLDARDIVLENSGYKKMQVIWKISDGKYTEEKVGEKVFFDVLRTQRYTIEAIYTYEKDVIAKKEIRTARDLIVIDLEKKALDPVINIIKSSDYVPSKITVDASNSQSKNNTIQKFIFDFGEGRPPAEGDAIQTYEYRTAGEYKITLTIIDSNNEKATTSKYIVLKDIPKTVGFTTSMSPGFVNTPVDFTAEGATGPIEEWIWNFGDNTPVSKGYETTHTFNNVGSYNVELTVRYIDGTEKVIRQNFVVEEMPE